MVIKREPVQIVEIDIDYCTLSYGVGDCPAVLGTDSVRKCYNSWNTCPVKNSYNKGSLTLRFVNPRANLPKGATYFPVLDNVSAFSSSVNIAGSNPKLGTLGKRGKVTVTLQDFPYHDRYTDKYALERVDGTAQTDESGYDPAERGTFWTKFKVRNPNYAGRPLRVINTYILEDGTFDTVNSQTRNFIVTEVKGPDDNNRVVIEAKDILTLAEKKSALAPSPSSGALQADITDNGTSLTLIPAGIGNDEYPTSGYAVIGSEVVQFTRSGDTVTLVERGARGTTASSHSAEDTFQIAVDYEDQLINQVIDDLLGNYTSISPSFIPSADYATEVTRWAGLTKINTTITEPTPVAELLGEMAVLGVSLWWDDVDQEIKLRMNHPIDVSETSTAISDDNSIKAIKQEDRDEERITQIHFYSVQSDPTEDVEDKSNYDRIQVTIDPDAQNENNFGETRVREIFCRWLNTGNDSVVRIIAGRLLQRFSRAPVYTHISLDAKDISLGLTDILDVTSRVFSDVTGASRVQKLQITEKTEVKSGHELKIVCQQYDFDDFYGFIMENDANDYDSATALELSEGCYIIAEADETFDDGRVSYKII